MRLLVVMLGKFLEEALGTAGRHKRDVVLFYVWIVWGMTGWMELQRIGFGIVFGAGGATI